MNDRKEYDSRTPSFSTSANYPSDPQIIADLASKLDLIVSQVASLAGPIGATNARYASTKVLIDDIRRIRKLRTQFFAEDLFADPAWDILLELKYAEYEQVRVSVSQLCTAAAVPATTALRWISLLVDRGIAIRTCDRLDGRRVYVSLHRSASEAMERFFQCVLGREKIGGHE